MIIRILDIPAEGRRLEFEPSQDELNRRDAASSDMDGVGYQFSPGGKADVFLQAEGSTVLLKGSAEVQYRTVCSRCAEEASKELKVDINMVLKPLPEGDDEPEGALDEDLNFGFYQNKEVDCGALVEEFLVLSVPYAVLCRTDCKGLCSKCGANLNLGLCSCPVNPSGDERFAVLRGLKLTQ